MPTLGEPMKAPYQAPTATVIGSIADLTRGNAAPVTSLDADFAAGTRFEDLGWSS